MNLPDSSVRHRRAELLVAAAILEEVASTTNGSSFADAVADILHTLRDLLRDLADQNAVGA